jgi:hypothetical protein
MTSKFPTQLLSTRINQFEDESGGHNNETAVSELSDNQWDACATETDLFLSTENKCWAMLNNGEGVKNIANIIGCGDGMKVKSSQKIGNKIQGEFASIYFFKPYRVLYFSRCPGNDSGPVHQQLNINVNDTIKVVKTPGMDLTLADKIIYEGEDGNSRKKLIRIPEPDTDKFDSDNSREVLQLFNNNEKIKKYFETNQSGMLKVFIYNEDTKAKFEKFNKDIPIILDKFEFITYNTLQVFREGHVFKFWDITNDKTRIINKESCEKNLIIGRNSVSTDQNFNDDEPDDLFVDDSTFGAINLTKALYIENTIYENNGKLHAETEIINFEKKFLIRSECKKTLITPQNEDTLQEYFAEDKKVGILPFVLVFLSDDETKEQKEKMHFSKNEELKQAYTFFNGRFLAPDKIPFCPQERSIPNVRLIQVIDSRTTKLIKIKGLKSSISLSQSNGIVLKLYDEIVKPILTAFTSQKSVINFAVGINNWKRYKRNIFDALDIPMPAPQTAPATNATNTNNTVLAPITAQITQPVVTSSVAAPPIPPPTPRAATEVFSALNKLQTINQLKRIKLLLRGLNPSIRTRGEKKKLLTKLYDIEREILLDDDILDEKIDNLIEVITASENQGNVKHATSLIDIK